jgi:hypothetical protein
LVAIATAALESPVFLPVISPAEILLQPDVKADEKIAAGEPENAYF